MEELILLIKKIELEFDGVDMWLTGGALRYIIGYDKEYSDIDLIVEQHNQSLFLEVLSSRFPDHKFTSFGGYRIFIDGKQIDIWIDSVANYISRCPTTLSGIALNIVTGAQICSKEYAMAEMMSSNTNSDIREYNFMIDDREVTKAESARFNLFLKGQFNDNSELSKV